MGGVRMASIDVLIAAKNSCCNMGRPPRDGAMKYSRYGAVPCVG